MEGLNQYFMMFAFLYWARVVLFVGISAAVLWFAFLLLPGGWKRWALFTLVALFWIVELVPGRVAFPHLCRREAGLAVTAAIPGQPDIIMRDRWASAIAARILYKAGRVEYALEDSLARHLGLLPGLYRFDSVADPASDCWNRALFSRETLAMCATATPIEAPGARYLFDTRGPVEGETAAGAPWDLDWWAEKHQARVVDRTTGETLATYTMLTRRRIPSVLNLVSYRAADAVCPKGQTPDGLSYSLFPDAFPDLGGRGR